MRAGPPQTAWNTAMWENMSLPECWSACANLDGGYSLPCVENEEENNFLGSLSNDGGSAVWVGLYQSKLPNGSSPVDGWADENWLAESCTSSFRNWYREQPDDGRKKTHSFSDDIGPLDATTLHLLNFDSNLAMGGGAPGFWFEGYFGYCLEENAAVMSCHPVWESTRCESRSWFDVHARHKHKCVCQKRAEVTNSQAATDKAAAVLEQLLEARVSPAPGCAPLPNEVMSPSGTKYWDSGTWVNFSQCVELCHEKGWTLPAPESKNESDFVGSIRAARNDSIIVGPKEDNNTRAEHAPSWLGLVQREGMACRDGWHWFESGSENAFRNWAPNQPNDGQLRSVYASYKPFDSDDQVRPRGVCKKDFQCTIINPSSPVATRTRQYQDWYSAECSAMFACVCQQTPSTGPSDNKTLQSLITQETYCKEGLEKLWVSLETPYNVGVLLSCILIPLPLCLCMGIMVSCMGKNSGRTAIIHGNIPEPFNPLAYPQVENGFQDPAPASLQAASESLQGTHRRNAKAMGMWRKGLLSIVAAGGIQFFDYLSDVVVVYSWWGRGEWGSEHTGYAMVGLGMMGLSYFFQVLLMFRTVQHGAGYEGVSLIRKAFMVLVLPALNLHLLAYGILPGHDHKLFYHMKAIETLLESVPMAGLMAIEITWSILGYPETPETYSYAIICLPFEERERIPWGRTYFVTVSSLCVSIMSMAVGISANCISMHVELQTPRRAAETFVLLVSDAVLLITSVALGVWHAYDMNCTSVILTCNLNQAGAAFGDNSKFFFWWLYLSAALPCFTYGVHLKQWSGASSFPSKLRSCRKMTQLLCQTFCALFSFAGCIFISKELRSHLIDLAGTIFFDAGYVSKSLYGTHETRQWALPVAVGRRILLLGMCFQALSNQNLASFVGTHYWALCFVLALVATVHTYLSLRFYHHIKVIDFDIGNLLLRLFGSTAKVSDVNEPGDEDGWLRSLSGGVDAEMELPECMRAHLGPGLLAWSDEGFRQFVDLAEAVLWYREEDSTGRRVMSKETEEEVVRLIARVGEELKKGVGDVGPMALVEAARDVLEEYNPAGEESDARLGASIKRLLMEARAAKQEGIGKGVDVKAEDSTEGEQNEQQQPCAERTVGPSMRRRRQQQHHADLEDGEGEWGFRQLPISQSANFWLWKSKVGTVQTSALSTRLEDGARCRQFVSHSWSDDWYRKVSQLRSHILLLEWDATVLFMTLVGIIVVLPLGFLWEGLQPGGGVWFILPALVLGVGLLSYAWARATGALLPALWGPWRSQNLGGVWLDKCCIDQTNDETKQAGIARLGQHLARCDTMTVMLGETYLSRLWCTYELAMFCSIHAPGVAEFLNLRERGNAYMAGDSSAPGKSREDLLAETQALIGVDASEGGKEGLQEAPQRINVPKLDDKINFLSLKWEGSLNPMWLFRKAELSAQETELLANYSCRKARCFMPKDRLTVLASIRDRWGSEAAFDAFVRNAFPGLLRRGKQRFMRRPGEVMLDVVSALF